MTSPFAAYQNATLRFQFASGALETDAATGNIRPSMGVITVYALLNQKRPPNQEALPGVDSTAVYLEGYVTEVVNAENPLYLPDVISPKNACQALFAGSNGRFFMQYQARSPYGVETFTGDRLKGWFQVSDFVVEGDEWDGALSATGVPSKLVRELLTITSNGQTSFTLAYTPQSPELSELYLNGVKVTYVTEYSINSNQLAWLLTSEALRTTDELEIVYYKV